MELRIPVSPDQKDVIIDHLVFGDELGMVCDEREWMQAHAQKAHPGCKILGADLDVLEAEWVLTLEETA